MFTLAGWGYNPEIKHFFLTQIHLRNIFLPPTLNSDIISQLILKSLTPKLPM